jgi:phosphoserine phosphatase
LDVIIRDVRSKVYREFKARAAKLGLKLGEALKLAMESWVGAETSTSVVGGSVENETYRKMKAELFRSYHGKHIAIAGGRLVAVSGSLDELARKLRDLGVSRALTVEVGKEESGEGGEWLWGSIALENASTTTDR